MGLVDGDGGTKVTIKVIVIADIHGRESALPVVKEKINEHDPDLLVICGDITHFGKPKEWARTFIDAISVDTIAVPGNCDPPDEVMDDIGRSKGYNLHGKTVERCGVTFTGIGGAMLSQHNLPFEMPDETLYSLLDAVMVKNAVLVTHMPPAGHVDSVAEGISLGSDGIARIVKKYKPFLVLSGHVHEARGIQYDGYTTFINPGPAKNGYAALVEIGDDNKVVAELL